LRPQYVLALFIPAAVALDIANASDTLVFFTAALALVPAAALMGRATEEAAARSGPGVGGLLNVTFGNAPELIIALFALGKGLHEVTKASIVGSIVGNLLLVLGAATFAVGLALALRATRRQLLLGLVAAGWILVAAGTWIGEGIVAGIPLQAVTWLGFGLAATVGGLE
jgi:Ca2+:H+ antiporter